jgi:hypothetical protein
MMSQRGIEFVQHWVFENINAEGYPPEGDTTKAQVYAEHCLIIAGVQGVPKQDIEDETGDLTAYMNRAICAANDAEFQRLVDSDKG